MTGYGTGPGALWRVRDEQRTLAESVACDTCGARPGEPCTNTTTGEALLRMPAHLARLRDADVPL